MDAPAPITPHPGDVAAAVEITQLEQDELRLAAQVLEDLAGAPAHRVYADDPSTRERVAHKLREIAARFDDAEKRPAV